MSRSSCRAVSSRQIDEFAVTGICTFFFDARVDDQVRWGHCVEHFESGRFLKVSPATGFRRGATPFFLEMASVLRGRDIDQIVNQDRLEPGHVGQEAHGRFHFEGWNRPVTRRLRSAAHAAIDEDGGAGLLGQFVQGFGSGRLLKSASRSRASRKNRGLVSGRNHDLARAQAHGRILRVNLGKCQAKGHGHGQLGGNFSN